jgi:hypothetical protein
MGELMLCHSCGRAAVPPGNQPDFGKRELRPYGPGGAPVCYECAFTTPERTAQTEGAFIAILEANEAISPTGATVLDGAAPRPLEVHEAEAIERAIERGRTDG